MTMELARPQGLDFRLEVDARLQESLAPRVRALLDVSADLEPVADVLLEAARGGKGLRAEFCFHGWYGALGRDEADDDTAGRSAVVGVGAALELFHLGCLVHDDVMDRSATRRGRPTVHAELAQQHAAQGLRGDATAHGDAMATLVGDLCLTWSDEVLRESLEGLPTRARVLQVFDTMRTQVIAGQCLDVLEQARPDTDLEAARRVVRFKTATYTVVHPLVMGGALAGGSDDLLERYEGFALPVGEAFQLRDDLLGVFGDPATTGKPSGDDVRDGTRTVLLALADLRAVPRQRVVLRHHVGDPTLDDRDLAEVRTVLLETGAVDEVEHEIEGLVEVALERLEELPVGEASREALRRLARRCAFRTT